MRSYLVIKNIICFHFNSLNPLCLIYAFSCFSAIMACKTINMLIGDGGLSQSLMYTTIIVFEIEKIKNTHFKKHFLCNIPHSLIIVVLITNTIASLWIINKREKNTINTITAISKLSTATTQLYLPLQAFSEAETE